VQESLSAHLDGENASLDSATVNAHLERCGECRALSTRLVALKRETSVQDHVTVPDLTSSILAALGAPSATSSVSSWRWATQRRWRVTVRWALPVVALGTLVPASALGAVGHFHVSPMTHVGPCVHTLMVHDVSMP
jgi:predicted anti-sigma-YlaC factor YlaD